MAYHKRCGCDCHNATTFEACEDRLHIPCCEFCEEAPSAYAVLWECCLECTDLLHLPRVQMVWKDCLFDCMWRSRTAGCDGFDVTPEANGGTCVLFNYTEESTFPIAFEDCYTFPINHPSADDIRAAYYDFYGMSASVAQSYQNCIDNETTILTELEVTAEGVAELQLLCVGSGGIAQCVTGDVVAKYLCEEFNCLDRSTFVRQGDYPLWFYAGPGATNPRYCIHLPNSVCVTPAVSQWRTPCDPPSAACACCDPGADSGYLFVDLGDCGGLYEDVLIERNATLSSGVSDPGGACGYFWGNLGTVCTGVEFGILTYCDGEDWQVELWCNHDGGGWNKIDEATATLTLCCPGAQYTWTFSGDWGDCCCPENIDLCCDDGIPATLYVTLAASSCSQLDGVTFEINNTGGGSWSGTFDASAAPGRCGTMTFYFDVTDGCNVYMYVKNAGGTIIWGDNVTPCGVLICPMTSEDCTYAVPACQVSIIPPLCSGNMTATVTP